MRNSQTILNIAKVKYAEAIRGREYQDEIIREYNRKQKEEVGNTIYLLDIEHVTFRKMIFQDRICLLEDIFTPTLLMESTNVEEN
jgi:hypothetical protein